MMRIGLQESPERLVPVHRPLHRPRPRASRSRPGSGSLPALGLALLMVLSSFLPLAGQDATVRTLTPVRSFSAEGFSRVRGVQELPDGRVLVADQREAALYSVDFDRQERTLLGRRGEGPGEYQAPTGLYPFRGDSVLMVDLQNGRFAIVSPDGSIGRTEPLFGRGISIPEGSDRRGNRYWDQTTAVRMEKRTDPSADQAPVVRYDAVRQDLDTLAYLTIPGPSNPNAFPAWDDWAVGPEGWVAIVRNQDEYRLDWVEPDGTVRKGSPVEGFHPLRVSDADQRAFQESGGGTPRGSVRIGTGPARKPSPIDVPDRFPPAKLGRIWVTFDGRAIVERHVHLEDEEPLFDLFDATGVRTGSFRLPEGREIVGTGPSGIFAVREDPLGLLWLEQYSL